MKVGIATWFQYHNYGSALQVVAMSRILRKLGYDPYVINYSNKNQPVVKKSPCILVDGAGKLQKKIQNHIYRRYQPEERERKFELFYEKELRFTDKCEVFPDLDKLNQELDAFVCGSDQIWAPTVYDPHYYLDYVRDKQCMIAYAPSIGLTTIADPYVRERMKELTSQFSYLSTREGSGSELLSSLIGKYVETVLDPTLLLNASEWETLENKDVEIKAPYMLVYMLGHNEKQWRSIYKIATKKRLQVKIIPVFDKDLKRKGCVASAIGPQEFLTLIHHAEFVCTDSYHGVLFAINYHKQFCAFERFGKRDKNSQNSRVWHILKTLGLEQCLFDQRHCQKPDEFIDYTIVEQKRKKEYVHSFQYLKNALEEVERHIREKAKSQIVFGGRNFCCCGCGACSAVCPTGAIQVVWNEKGFQYATLDEQKCISCGQCIRSCPEKNTAQYSRPIKQSMLYSYKDLDGEVLKHSSSGGFAYRLAEVYLRKRYSVYGCAFDADRHIAKHIQVTEKNAGDLYKLQGSKYMQSVFAPVMQQIGKSRYEKKIVFGTPCQIAGVRQITGSNIDVILVDLICHGVPTKAAYDSYMRYLVNKKGFHPQGAVWTDFRYKVKGWRNIYIYNSDGKRKFCASEKRDPYFLHFTRGFSYAPSCYECPWRASSAADLRIGDYWGKQYAADKSGVSMLCVITDRGRQCIEELRAQEAGIISEQNIEDYFACQQTDNRPRPVFWEELIEELKTDRPMEKIIKEFVMPYEKRMKFWKAISRIKEVCRKNEKH